MSAATRVAVFVALLAATFGAATVAGRAVDPDVGDENGAGEAHGGGEKHGSGAGDRRAEAPRPGHDAPDGLSVADAGYRLQAASPTRRAGHRAPLRFRIVDARGQTVRDFDVEQARRMHIIVVRRDLSGYQHLHPAQAADGTWSVPLALPAPGAYRAFADFRVDGEQHVLGVDLLVPGRFAPRALPPPGRLARVDGYEISLHSNGSGNMGFGVRRDGAPVTDLEPYLGALGHLVALRDGDLSYRHAHPVRSGSSGEISFEGVRLQPGTYRLFLQFRTRRRVHTAAFTYAVTP